MGEIVVGKKSKNVQEMFKNTSREMKIEIISTKELSRFQNVFIPLFQNRPLLKEVIFSSLSGSWKTSANRIISKEFSGEGKEIKSFYIPHVIPERLVLFGLGEKEKWNTRKFPLLVRRMVQYAKQEKIKEFATPFAFLHQKSESHPYSARIFAENAVMANFDFTFYKETPKEGWPSVERIALAVTDALTTEIKQSIKEGQIIGEETNHARRLANTPGGEMTPSILAKEAHLAGKRHGIRIHVQVLGKKELEKLGAGGILGVGKGSQEEPRLIIMEYRHNNGSIKKAGSIKPLVLIGKGVTFDTGGLNLKSENAIHEMHMDMSGGAAVIHGIAAIARLNLPVHVYGIIPAVENMPSGSSYRPGDILKSLSGKTIEILNTDAEGRVILADALTYAKRFAPGLVVTFATLTGSSHVALGNYCSAILTPDTALQNKMIEIGERSGDYVWPLPLWDEYLEEIRGTFGDLANMGKVRYGDTIHAAKFLEQFAGKSPWAHIDIAPRMTTVDADYLSKGASGVGVRFIFELAKIYYSDKLAS